MSCLQGCGPPVGSLTFALSHLMSEFLEQVSSLPRIPATARPSFRKRENIRSCLSTSQHNHTSRCLQDRARRADRHKDLECEDSNQLCQNLSLHTGNAHYELELPHISSYVFSFSILLFSRNCLSSRRRRSATQAQQTRHMITVHNTVIASISLRTCLQVHPFSS